MFGEIALWSFVILLLTGTYLALFFDPSSAPVVYYGSYTKLDGLTMSVLRPVTDEERAVLSARPVTLPLPTADANGVPTRTEASIMGKLPDRST